MPNTCGRCQYGNTFDLSVDDLCTYCMVLGKRQDWSDFPRRNDGALRMNGCPLPYLSERQIKIAEIRKKECKVRAGILNRIIHGKTKLIRKRNLGRAKKIANCKRDVLWD